MRFYHGTHVDSARSLEVALSLDAAVAAQRHIDGEAGFYLATAESDAEFFALRRWKGRIVVIEVSGVALRELEDAGAQRRPIPGGRPPYFAGEELFVPTSLFRVFNELAERGEILVEH